MTPIDRRGALSHFARLALAAAVADIASIESALSGAITVDDRPSTFAEEMAASMPPGLALPAEFLQLFAFLEANGYVNTFKRGRGRYALLYPEPWRRGMSLVSFQPGTPEFARQWTGSDDPAVTLRLAEFCRTGGDGSHAALWRDDAGKLWIVHLGSGSGSTWLGVITDKPVDFLRFLAIGYIEACWDEHFALPPAAASVAGGGDGAVIPPAAFRAHVEKTHGVSIPRVGADIVRSVSHMGDARSSDPFWLWLTKLQNEREKK